ncbi:hypothetical protein KIN20_006057 [Parelaphostrongylus tenuis]|uniref:Uncharacterized protein n=1 Tax=Parelaphostrongylus tenuis TaxID=148309 RepID=A0AAD5M1A1_PARTN|nr:hypothetical protein KIN20_006057 [Parelaphostrongylus tenuis]
MRDTSRGEGRVADTSAIEGQQLVQSLVRRLDIVNDTKKELNSKWITVLSNIWNINLVRHRVRESCFLILQPEFTAVRELKLIAKILQRDQKTALPLHRNGSNGNVVQPNDVDERTSEDVFEMLPAVESLSRTMPEKSRKRCKTAVKIIAIVKSDRSGGRLARRCSAIDARTDSFYSLEQNSFLHY